MTILLVVLVPIIALVVWGIIFDLKRRRRHAVLTSHDIGSAARRARRTPTLVTWGGPTRAAGVPGVSDKVQLGAGFPCGGSPRALPLISGCCLGCPARRTGSAPRAAVRYGRGGAQRSRLDPVRHNSATQR